MTHCSVVVSAGLASECRKLLMVLRPQSALRQRLPVMLAFSLTHIPSPPASACRRSARLCGQLSHGCE